jgi:3-deoxy-D-manno-octulosonate 8-phosphate phosphatase KdsC-like HAD superfamily phosphatase
MILSLLKLYMISKKCFIASIEKIENFRKKQQNATEVLHKIFNMNGHSVLNFGDCLIDEIINLLSMSFDSNDHIKDIKEWFNWYWYQKGKDGKVRIGEKKYIVKNASDLYDVILDWIFFVNSSK